MRGVAADDGGKGVALLGRRWPRPARALLMQLGGVAIAFNMLSLTQIFRLPFLTL